MKVTRRQFLKTVAASAAALGLSQLQVTKLAEVLAKGGPGSAINVIWLQGQNCTGCTTSFAGLEWDGNTDAPAIGADVGDVRAYLNGANPDISGPYPSTLAVLGATGGIWDDEVTTVDDVVLDIINLQYNQTIMATAGVAAHDALVGWMAPGGWGVHGDTNVLIVEGSVPPAALHSPEEKFCSIGSELLPENGEPKELYVGKAIRDLANNATIVLAVGTCASFGGIPAAKSDPTRGTTGATDVGSYIHAVYPTKVVVNVPGCPPNPDWIFGTIVHYLLGSFVSGGQLVNLDSQTRPTFFYGDTNHGGRCPRYQAYCDGQFATFPGEDPSSGGTRHFTVGLPSTTPANLGQHYNIPLCLIKLGCKGPSTGADCAFGGPGETATAYGRGWNRAHAGTWGNTGANPVSHGSCINNGHPCMGCTEKGFPDKYSPFLSFTTKSPS